MTHGRLVIETALWNRNRYMRRLHWYLKHNQFVQDVLARRTIATELSALGPQRGQTRLEHHCCSLALRQTASQQNKSSITLPWKKIRRASGFFGRSLEITASEAHDDLYTAVADIRAASTASREA
jgi:hypothetical protein